jgi:hypothetical protein
VLLNLIALVLAVTVMQLAQPSFNKLLDQQLSLAYLLGQGVGGWAFTAGLALMFGWASRRRGSTRPSCCRRSGRWWYSRANTALRVAGTLLRKVLVAGHS